MLAKDCDGAYHALMAEILREIVLDTETTGLGAATGDRIIEIGCVELVNHAPNGRTYHVYVNPERDIQQGAQHVHGITSAFLQDKPLFKDIAKDFLEFIGEANIVAHNAIFDMGFINMELKRADLPEIPLSRMVDTLAISRKKNPHFAKHDLDSLCSRYGIDNSHRELHGALLDARLLAEVYIELLGGKEIDFFKKSDEEIEVETASAPVEPASRGFRPARSFPPTADELAAHAEFVKSLGEGALWAKVG
jgi:DNA polymerase-3 subunit epsilon